MKESLIAPIGPNVRVVLFAGVQTDLVVYVFLREEGNLVVAARWTGPNSDLPMDRCGIGFTKLGIARVLTICRLAIIRGFG